MQKINKIMQLRIGQQIMNTAVTTRRQQRSRSNPTMRTTQSLSSSRLFISLFVWIIYALSGVDAKKVSGNIKLSGENSEIVLSKYAVVPEGARLTVQFSTGDTMYEDEQYLRLHLFRDVEWSQFKKALTCADRIKFASQALSVTFDWSKEDKKWASNSIQASIVNNKADGNKKTYRPHYWYAVLDDCSLEMGYQRDQKVPLMHYELEFVNQGKDKKETHLSADEFGLIRLHLITMVFSMCVAAYLVLHVLSHMVKSHSVHAAVLWVLLAAALDASSSLLEILHLRVYDGNGIGSYWADALAAHCESLCDASLELLLLTVGAGWTLPSDVVKVNPNESVVQKLVSDLARPAGGSSGATAVAITILAFHVILAQWGRTYNEDFESYHDLEHLPGRMLMGFRLLCGLLLVVATVQTRHKCSNRNLQRFYDKLAVLGFAWFISLPLLSLLCSWFVPYYLRHPAIFSATALCQSSSLLLFAWLVTSHSTAYHQFSHMATSSGKSSGQDMSLTEALHTKPKTAPSSGLIGGDSNEPRTWKLGKAKVRLD